MNLAEVIRVGLYMYVMIPKFLNFSRITRALLCGKLDCLKLLLNFVLKDISP